MTDTTTVQLTLEDPHGRELRRVYVSAKPWDSDAIITAAGGTDAVLGLSWAGGGLEATAAIRETHADRVRAVYRACAAWADGTKPDDAGDLLAQELATTLPLDVLLLAVTFSADIEEGRVDRELAVEVRDLMAGTVRHLNEDAAKARATADRYTPAEA